jgi:predicted transcriptional regulator
MKKLNDNNKNNSGAFQDEEKPLRKQEVITSLHHYSDLSIKNIARQVDMPLIETQRIIDKLAKLNASRLFEEESTTRIEKIMSTDVVTLDISKTAADAAALMTENRVGSVVVVKNDRPFGIVTERDLEDIFVISYLKVWLRIHL